MAEVLLHVYDVTNSVNVKANTAIVQLNKLMRDGIGVGGIFHGAIQLVSDGGDEEICFDGHSLKILKCSRSRVYEEEWSFGYCENGSGVFSCPPKENPMYTYRETVPLGRTTLSPQIVNQILMEMSREWQGCTYDLLARNCNHFCEVFCARLGVQKLPLWVNRFAKTGDAAVEVAGNTLERLKQAKDDMVSASRGAYRFLFGERPTPSAISPDSGMSNASLGGSNSSRRFTFSRTPSRLFSRTSVDCPAEESTMTECDISRASVFQWRSSLRRSQDLEREPSTPGQEHETQEPSSLTVEEPSIQSSVLVLGIEEPEAEPPLQRVEQVSTHLSSRMVEDTHLQPHSDSKAAELCIEDSLLGIKELRLETSFQTVEKSCNQPAVDRVDDQSPEDSLPEDCPRLMRG